MIIRTISYLALSCSIICAQTSQLKKEPERFLNRGIQRLLNKTDKKTVVGIKVLSLTDHKVLYEKNPDRTFIPASNMKFVTSEAAFHILGPQFRFTTQVVSDKPIVHGKLDTLYIKGSGDPSLTSTDLEQMVIELKNKGLLEVKNIVLDASVFDLDTVAPGWNKGDLYKHVKAPVGGLMVNSSSVDVYIKPAAVPGRKPLVRVTPHNVIVENQAKTVTHAKKHSFTISRVTSANKITISGAISTKQKPKRFKRSVTNPSTFFGSVFKSLLVKHKILVTGTVKQGKIPEKVHRLVYHESAPLTKLVRRIMKYSDNPYSDALFKKMGAKLFKTQGTWASGKKAVEAFLRERVGLDMKGLVINDGSGFSHDNKISPNHLSELLYWIYTKSPYKSEGISSLPISGIDGTLKNRLKDKKTKHKVKAKTGSLNGVSSLAGFIIPNHGHKLAFVIMANRKNVPLSSVKRTLEDHVCTLLATHAFSTS